MTHTHTQPHSDIPIVTFWSFHVMRRSGCGQYTIIHIPIHIGSLITFDPSFKHHMAEHIRPDPNPYRQSNHCGAPSLLEANWQASWQPKWQAKWQAQTTATSTLQHLGTRSQLASPMDTTLPVPSCGCLCNAVSSMLSLQRCLFNKKKAIRFSHICLVPFLPSFEYDLVLFGISFYIVWNTVHPSISTWMGALWYYMESVGTC